MRQYHDLVSDVLSGGTYKPNRTGVDTVASFSQHYEVDRVDAGSVRLVRPPREDVRNEVVVLAHSSTGGCGSDGYRTTGWAGSRADERHVEP